MTRIPSIAQEWARDPDDDQQWEDLTDDELLHRSRPSSTTPSNSLRGTASSPRTRRTTRQRAVFATTSPRKPIHGDFRSSVRTRRERGFVVELPPQELLSTASSPRGFPVKPLSQEPTDNPVPQYISTFTLRPQQPTSTAILQRGSIGELPSQELASNAGPDLGSIFAASFMRFLCYVAEVLDTVVRMMKFPISIALAVMICAYSLAIMSEAVRSAFAPMCSIPVVSLLCPTLQSGGRSHSPNPDRTPRWADFPSLLKVESKTLESLLDESVEGSGLAIEIKKAEMATSDLATMVRVSNLNSREVLADTLSEFVKDARKVSRGLTRFSSRVGGAVDRCVFLLSALSPPLTAK